MNIILVSNKMAKAKTLSFWQIALAAVSLVAFSVLLTMQLLPEKQSQSTQPKTLNAASVEEELISSQSHLDAYAKQLGELQARIVRLDAQNQRLASLAGEKVPSSMTATVDIPTGLDYQGGPLVSAQPMTEDGLKVAIENLVASVDMRDDYQSEIESKILQQSVVKDMLPNSKPIVAGYRSSSYGWRRDPFTGRKAFHEGLDFPARSGTPILAAADGIVITATRSPAYGNLIKLDHGAGLETRYAHASKLLVKVGERVVKGQKIALVGSTGRSTGPHLHYEIRLNGSALDPRRYLKKKS